MDGFLFLFVSLMTLLTSSTEGPVELSSVPPTPGAEVEHQHDTHVISFEEKSKQDGEVSNEEKEKYNHSINRSNYSRMLPLTTTLGYDEWWFYTTRISPISLKDFPGRPGVASWKEISRSSPTENRKSRKMTGPQAAGVSSGSWSFFSNCYHSQMTSTGIWMLLFLVGFCWT